MIPETEVRKSIIETMNEFDARAPEWDSNPMHRDRSEAVVREMLLTLPLNVTMRALEYGAGTGIASFLLKNYLKEIILMDSSEEMIRITNEKIAAGGASNLRALQFDLEVSDYEGDKFDLIFTQMVLHHVNDIESIIGKFSKLLAPGGYIAIADLYEEDGSFHGEGFSGHRGFNPGNLSEILEKYSFSDITHRKCFEIVREIPGEGIQKYDVFLLSAKRN